MNRETALSFISNHKDININNLIDILVECDDLYANDGQSYITDAEYDKLYLIGKTLDPTNKYFIGVGSTVRGEKVTLPFPMGSLDQTQEGEIQNWAKGIEDKHAVISDKMDGVSGELIYDDNGDFQIAFSRGNGIEGQDITRHVKLIPDLPRKVSGKKAIRVEFEFSETNFKKIKPLVLRKGGEEFKNARNAMAGLLNNKLPNDVAAKHMNVIAYEVMNSDKSKTDQLIEMERDKFNVVGYTKVLIAELRDEDLKDFIKIRKAILDFEIDGIVLEVDDVETRNRLTSERKSETLNPAYATKYKIADDNLNVETIVEGVTWNVSKHGFAKPTVNLVPFDLQGVTISNTTGFNAKYIFDNKIGKGTKVLMTRSGDVIPYIVEVLSSTQADMPDELFKYEWNDTNVDLVLTDLNDDQVVIKQLVSWSTSLDIPQLKEGLIIKLFESGFKRPQDIVNMTKGELVDIVGKNGEKVYDGMVKVFTDIPVEKLLGSFPQFEVGLGVRKFKMLTPHFTPQEMLNFDYSENEICSIDGFERITAEKIMKGCEAFKEYVKDIDGKFTLQVKVEAVTEGDFVGQKVCFTGFRDKDLEAKVIAQGGEIASGVSKKTNILVTSDPNSTSGKTKKARDLGIEILSVDQLKEKL